MDLASPLGVALTSRRNYRGQAPLTLTHYRGQAPLELESRTGTFSSGASWGAGGVKLAEWDGAGWSILGCFGEISAAPRILPAPTDGYFFRRMLGRGDLLVAPGDVTIWGVPTPRPHGLSATECCAP